MRRPLFLIAAAAASVLLLAACGEDETTPTTSSATSAAATADDTPASSETIAELVGKNPEFSTLLAAVEEAGLAKTLSSPGPFTVFAPTDAAFAELPEGTLDTLLKPAKQKQLEAILTYHVVPGEVMAADITPGEVTTVNSAPLAVAVDADGVQITDGQGNQANVIKTDVEASNGVVHVIDSVLLPEGM